MTIPKRMNIELLCFFKCFFDLLDILQTFKATFNTYIYIQDVRCYLFLIFNQRFGAIFKPQDESIQGFKALQSTKIHLDWNSWHVSFFVVYISFCYKRYPVTPIGFLQDIDRYFSVITSLTHGSRLDLTERRWVRTAAGRWGSDDPVEG